MKYTIKDIKNADCFVLVHSSPFVKAKLHKEYVLFKYTNNVFYLADGVKYNIIKNGKITEKFRKAIRDNVIRFYTYEDSERPETDSPKTKFFDINETAKVHHSDPQLYDVTVRVDADGLEFLKNKQREVELVDELNILHQLKKTVLELIDKLDKMIK